MENEEGVVCRPCEIEVGEQKQEDCILFQDYITGEEEGVLSSLRRLKKESRVIRDKIRTLEKALESVPQNQSESSFHRAQEGIHRELGIYFQQLEKLRNDWKEWEARREAAHERKMARLGYNA